MSGHGIYYYACGKHIKSQCRCPEDTKHVTSEPCPTCKYWPIRLEMVLEPIDDRENMQSGFRTSWAEAVADNGRIVEILCGAGLGSPYILLKIAIPGKPDAWYRWSAEKLMDAAMRHEDVNATT